MPLMPGMPPGMMGPHLMPGAPAPHPMTAPGGPPPGPMPHPAAMTAPPAPMNPAALQQLTGPGGPGGPGGTPPLPEKLDPGSGMNPEENAALELALGNPHTKQMLGAFALQLLTGNGPGHGQGIAGLADSGRQDAEPHGGLGAGLGG